MEQTLIEQLGKSCQHYGVVSQTGEQMSLESQFAFDKSFSGFQGHFPGNPILPGIIQLAAVRFTVQQCTGRKYLLTGLSHTKFKDIVKPGDKLLIQVNLQKRGDGFGGDFALSVDEHSISIGKFELKSRGEVNGF